jgi:hypothetical protein
MGGKINNDCMFDAIAGFHVLPDVLRDSRTICLFVWKSAGSGSGRDPRLLLFEKSRNLPMVTTYSWKVGGADNGYHIRILLGDSFVSVDHLWDIPDGLTRVRTTLVAPMEMDRMESLAGLCFGGRTYDGRVLVKCIYLKFSLLYNY